ncbi:hypothetical protein KFL_008300050 [Klebsormidium nitens]|uniref:CCHC-type domain-containing protein n=1 Tax=Klebsormidium nitens TaxID=105231 RepID=A0A1Y1ITZ9_KLENI|nr:hypothetical protein KFL_008300050 [Klebsormidium nitens]|eukprot:GAQ91668.1 hypothetical protein KFL_008300050 [Klebsormidium nitens]
MARGRPHGRSKSDHRVCQEARYARAAEYRERISISVEQQEARIAAVNAECDVQDASQKRRSQKSSSLKKEAWTARGSAQRGYCTASGSGANQRLGKMLGKAAERDLHSLHCHACGTTAELGLRGSKEGGSVKYSCRTHAPSTGCFRVDKDRAGWAEDRELRRLRAEERRLEEELRNLGGTSFAAKPTSAWNESQSTGDWASLPMSKSLIATHPIMGGLESNPGPTADEGLYNKDYLTRELLPKNGVHTNPQDEAWIMSGAFTVEDLMSKDEEEPGPTDAQGMTGTASKAREVDKAMSEGPLPEEGCAPSALEQIMGSCSCFHRGEEGHVSPNCPNGCWRLCFMCGEDGHFARDCINEGFAGNGRRMRDPQSGPLRDDWAQQMAEDELGCSNKHDRKMLMVDARHSVDRQYGSLCETVAAQAGGEDQKAVEICDQMKSPSPIDELCQRPKTPNSVQQPKTSSVSGETEMRGSVSSNGAVKGQPSKNMQVFVRTPGGMTVARAILQSATAAQLLKTFQGSSPEADTRLTFCGRPLEASTPLRSCGVKANHTLDLLLRLRGGGDDGAPPGNNETAGKHDEEIEMELCIWRTSDLNAIPKGETEGIPMDIKLLPDTAAEEAQRLHLLDQFGKKERVFVWGRPLRPGGDPVFREVERAKALKAPPLMERLTQRPQIKVFSAAGRRGQDAEAGQSTDVEMQDADQGSPDYARSDILALQNWAAISDAGLKASSSDPRLEKSRDAEWFCVQHHCEAVISRARGALGKLQTELQIVPFEQPSQLAHAAEINQNKIPLARGEPSLLVDRLPSSHFKELTRTQAPELLEAMEKRHTFQNLSVTSFMAASGYGKTRTALELGCLRAGLLYFSCCGQEEVGSSDLWELLGRLKVTCKEGSDSWESNQARVQKHVYAVLLSRLKHLSECLFLGCDPQQWLLYQLVAVYQGQQDTFAEAYNVLRHASLEELKELVHTELAACLSTLKAEGVKFLILVLDEAQLWAKELPGMFSNGAVAGQAEGRPLLSAFLAVIASDSALFKNIHVVLSGTGLSLSQSMLVASALMKVGSKPFPVVEFGTFNEASALTYLVSYAGSQDIPEHDLKFLVGRRRFAARVVLDWALSGQEDVLTCLRSLVRLHTTEEGKERFLANELEDVYERQFLYGRLGALLKRGVEGHKLLELLKRVAFAYARLGAPCLFLHHKEFDLVDLGFVKLHRSPKNDIVASIEEPLAVRALSNFLERELKWSAKEHTLTLMAQSKPFPAMLGQWFELVAPDQLPQLFETDGALADMPLFSNLKRELPECFQREGASLARVRLAPDGKYCFETVANPTGLDAVVRLATKGMGVLEWLQNPNGVVWFFPETSAGPDLLFFVVVGGQLYLVICQLKLRWKLDSLARAIQTVDPKYLFEGKVDKEELRKVAQKALSKERGVDGVISLFIGYPLRTRMREFVAKKTAAEEEDRKRKGKQADDDNMVEPSIRVKAGDRPPKNVQASTVSESQAPVERYGMLSAADSLLCTVLDKHIERSKGRCGSRWHRLRRRWADDRGGVSERKGRRTDVSTKMRRIETKGEGQERGWQVGARLRT